MEIEGNPIDCVHVLERLYRDARAGYLHSFTTNALYDDVGRLELS